MPSNLAPTGKKSKHEFLKALGQLAGMFTKEMALNVITKAIQSQIDTNDAVVTLDGEAIGDLKFDIVDSNMINFQAETTDNYIDTNRPVQDHVIKKPIEITLKGRVGRYVNKISENKLHSPIYYRNMNLISAYIPKIPGANFAVKVRQKINNIAGGGIIGQLINSVTSYAYGLGMNLLNEAWHEALYKYNLSIKNDILKPKDTSVTKEHEAFRCLMSLWELSREVEVHTYWWTFKNMIITNLRPLKEDGDITEFTVTLKQLNKVSSIVTKNVKVAKQPVEGQKSESVNNGKTKGAFTELSDEEAKQILAPKQQISYNALDYNTWGDNGGDFWENV